MMYLFTFLILTSYSISENLQDLSKVYYGTLNSFEYPTEIIYEELLKETKEYKEIQKKNIKRGTGQYWLLMAKASQNVKNSIEKYAKEHDTIDIITEKHYIKSCDDTIEVLDITTDVIEYMKKQKN
jgi:hypothetical protein